MRCPSFGATGPLCFQVGCWVGVWLLVRLVCALFFCALCLGLGFVGCWLSRSQFPGFWHRPRSSQHVRVACPGKARAPEPCSTLLSLAQGEFTFDLVAFGRLVHLQSWPQTINPIFFLKKKGKILYDDLSRTPSLLSEGSADISGAFGQLSAGSLPESEFFGAPSESALVFLLSNSTT